MVSKTSYLLDCAGFCGLDELGQPIKVKASSWRTGDYLKRSFLHSCLLRMSHRLRADPADSEISGSQGTNMHHISVK